MPEGRKRTTLWIKKQSLRFLILGAISFLLCWWVIPFCYDLPDLENNSPEQSSVLLDRHGNQLQHATREDYVRHRKVELDQLPQLFIQATLAAEDKRFWDHGGVDLLAVTRSIKDSLKHRKVVSGASTITQQTVKLSTKSHQRTFSTKIHEMFQARRVEMHYNKEEILQAYFNHLHYGNRSQGPKQAAKHYFQKSLDELSLAETALLAGLPQAPSRHNPRSNPESALARRNWILDRMAQVYQLDPDEIQRAKNESLSLAPINHTTHFPELSGLLEKGSASITTSIDLPLSKKVQQIAKEELSKIKDLNVNNSAVVVIHNPTGEILCLMGSHDQHSSIGGQYNAALLERSPGSALKPFVYLMGFEKAELSPASIIADIPTYYAGERGAEEFVNYNRKHHGPVTISAALGNSYNIPALKVLNATGKPEQFRDYLKTFGFSTLNQPAATYGLTLAIGGGEITLLDITNAYATLARQGSYLPTSLIKGKSTESKRVADSDQCYLIAQIMSDNRSRSHTFGIKSHLRFPFPCAVKTGTSTDYKDNFCVGFTKEFTVGVWVGNTDNTPMKGVSGVTGAGPIFHRTMLAIHQKTSPTWLTKPSNVQSYAVDPHTGKQLTKDHPRYSIAQKLDLIYSPDFARADDYDQKHRPLLDQRYSEWTSMSDTHFALRNDPSNNAPISKLKILSPTKGATYLLDPDIPNQANTLPLKANHPATQWHSDSLLIKDNTATLTPGTHTITATHNGQTQSIQIKVQQL